MNDAMADGRAKREAPGFSGALDETTLARAKRGDVRAFESIYRLYAGASYTLALRMLGEPAAAEDVVQDVFVKLFDGVRGYRGDAPFGPWLKRLVANRAIDVLRGNRSWEGDDPERLFDRIPARSRDADVELDLATALGRLPGAARAVVILHELEGFTHTDIAMRFGMTESWSKTVLARSLQRLQDETRPSTTLARSRS